MHLLFAHRPADTICTWTRRGHLARPDNKTKIAPPAARASIRRTATRQFKTTHEALLAHKLTRLSGTLIHQVQSAKITFHS